MGIQLASLGRNVRQALTGPNIWTETFAATGLTANAANTLPFPVSLPQVPVRVSLQPVGNGAVGAVVSLDTSQGATDPTGSFAGGKLGYSATNIYVFIGDATQCVVTVEYGGA
jgi:hypothetical protein